jgi:sec-independent protein translocase protein TatB
MFDIGWGELVVIGIVALIAIGPKELPTVLRTIGQYMGKVRRMASEFQGQFQEALREAEVADLQKQAEEWKSSVTDFANYDPLADTENNTAASPETATASETTEGAPATDPEGLAVPDAGIDLPLPEPLPPVTAEDFAQAEPQAAPPPHIETGDETPEATPAPIPKQAGGAA